MSSRLTRVAIIAIATAAFLFHIQIWPVVAQKQGEKIGERIFDKELGRWLTPLEIGKAEVYLTEEEAVRLLLPQSDTVRAEVRELTPAQKSCVQERIGWKFQETSFKFFIGETNGTVDGYASIQHTIGKYRPIDYIVGITPDAKVTQMEVMVYRESVGAEVRKPRFNYQYKGKDSSDYIRINRDIINITGATMSVRSISAGVKRALVLTEELYLNPRETPCQSTTQSKNTSRGWFERLFGN